MTVVNFGERRRGKGLGSICTFSCKLEESLVPNQLCSQPLSLSQHKQDLPKSKLNYPQSSARAVHLGVWAGRSVPQLQTTSPSVTAKCVTELG